jgi:hypothetical protein
MLNAAVTGAISSWHWDSAIAGLERAAASTGARSDVGLWLFAPSIASRTLQLGKAPPTGLVPRLLVHPQRQVKSAGLALVTRAQDVDPAAVTRLLDGPDRGLRLQALAAWQVLGQRQGVTPPEALVRRAAADPDDVTIRYSALMTLSTLAQAGKIAPPTRLLLRAAEEGPEVDDRRAGMIALVQLLDAGKDVPRARIVELVSAAARGAEQREVRETAIDHLASLGDDGARTAMDLLEEPGFLASGYVESAVWAAVEGGRAAELIDRNPPARVALIVLDAIGGLDPEDYPGRLEALAAPVGRLLARRDLFREDGASEVVGGLLDTLDTWGWEDVLRQVAGDREVPVDPRATAFYLLIERQTTHASGVALGSGVLRDASSPAELRMSLLESFEDAAGSEWASRAFLEAEVRRVARDDPSFWVRERAREALENRFDEEEDDS